MFKKRLYVILTIFIVCVFIACSLPFGDKGIKETQFGKPEENSTYTVQVSRTAFDVIQEMKVGWNLGCSLDSFDKNKNNDITISERRNSYQIMASFETETYSGWNASSVPYFSSKEPINKYELTWNITNLDTTDSRCGSFSVQIINHELYDSGEQNLDFSITKAEFKTAKGTVVNFKDMIKNYKIPIKEGKTALIKTDLTKSNILNSTDDILGGTLTIAVTIHKYPKSLPEYTLTAAEYYETLWGNPITTKEIITAVKKAGFGAIRIPVTYYDHMTEDYIIDEGWLNRIEEVTQYVLDNNMYCIINVHNDTGEKGWLRADVSTVKETSEALDKIWTQIAERFKDYNYKLIFEGFNEILNSSNDWSNAGKDSYEAVNILNQVFVDSIRKTGGKNSERFLTVNTYAASVDSDALESFVLPKDSIPDHLIVQVHFYKDIDQAKKTLSILDDIFTQKNIPVIIGECGVKNHMEEEARTRYASELFEMAKEKKITCFWWDDGGNFESSKDVTNYALLNRRNRTWYFYDILQGIIKAASISK